MTTGLETLVDNITAAAADLDATLDAALAHGAAEHVVLSAYARGEAL